MTKMKPVFKHISGVVVVLLIELRDCVMRLQLSAGVLQDLSRGNKTDPQQMRILSFITYIGCGISAIFLSVTLLTYLSFE